MNEALKKEIRDWDRQLFTQNERLCAVEALVEAGRLLLCLLSFQRTPRPFWCEYPANVLLAMRSAAAVRSAAAQRASSHSDNTQEASLNASRPATTTRSATGSPSCIFQSTASF